MILAFSILVALLMGRFLFRKLFDGFDDFKECVGFWFTPDLISFFRGEWTEDQQAEFKLFVFLALSAASGVLSYLGLHKLFG